MDAKAPTPLFKIAFSCPQDWNNMTSCQGGRFCSTCQKSVYDFSEKTTDEVITLLQEHSNICARFQISQVHVEQDLPSQGSYWRKAVASLFLALGFTTLAKSVKAQSSLSHQQDSVQNTQDTKHVWGGVVETVPVYKHGGQEGLLKFIRENLQNPTHTKGNAIVSFVVNSNGKTIDIEIVKGISKETDKEAKRIVQLLEFVPATRIENKQKIKHRLTLPIAFE